MEDNLFDKSADRSKAKGLWLTAMDIVLFIVLVIVIDTLAAMPLKYAFAELPIEEIMKNIPLLILRQTIMMVSVFVAAIVVLRIRKIPFSQIGLSYRGKDLLAGILFAVVLYALGFGISLLLGVVEVVDIHFQAYSLLLALVYFLLVSVVEEVAMRGLVLGRLLDGRVNKFWALLISSTLFSLIHLSNPNFTLIPFINILLAGLMLGASYLYTRNLCFPIALHWFWNWLQGPVLGYEVSGNRLGDSSLLAIYLPESNLINGGAFGFEGSILCTALMVIGTVIIIGYYTKRSASKS